MNMPLKWPVIACLVVGCLFGGLEGVAGLLGAKMAYASEGYATYYTAESCRLEGNSGVYTASGEIYDEQALTCALPIRRWGSMWHVYCPDTGREVVVRLNDYGPGKRPRARGVIIDLSPTAFKELIGPYGSMLQGRIRVEVMEVIDV